MSIEEKLWSRVDKSGGPNACWPWTAKARHVFGYGCLSINNKLEASHRVAYTIAYGDIPEGAHVLHTCDNPPCCNPKHLFLGDNVVNMKDMYKKDRYARSHRNQQGEKHWNARFTNEEAENIRELRAKGAKMIDLANLHNVERHTISRIIHHKTY
ncbi:MAG: HNH endonuclease signature motif containing protein [Thermodesulfobacteriota bacterium]